VRVSSVIFDDSSTVDEETAQALAIHEAVRDDIQGHFNQQWSRLKLAIAAAIILIIAGIGGVAIGEIGIGIALLGIGILGGVGGGAYVRSQTPDVTVSSVQKGYWTGYLVPDGDETVVFDATESIDPQQFQLNLLKDPEQAQGVKEQLASMDEFPVVMNEENDVEDQFVSSVSAIETELENSETHEVTAPVLQDDDPAIESLSQLASKADSGSIDAGGVALSQQEAEKQVETFDEFESMADEDRGESVLLDVSEQSRQIASDLSGHQKRATKLLNQHVATAGDMFGLISYNFYCPDCMDDDIESLLEIRQEDGQWYCATCRSAMELTTGIPRHRIRDEIILDTWDQLWIEKDDQKREVYESIEDQKAELTEREFEQRREEIRSVEDRIKDIRAKIRDLQTEARAKQGIVKEMGELMSKYERLQQQKIERFRADVNQSFEAIDEETERVLKETEGVVEDRIEEAEKEAEARAETMREEERQRHRETIATQKAIAKDRAARDRAHTAAVMSTIAVTNQNKPERRGE